VRWSHLLAVTALVAGALAGAGALVPRRPPIEELPDL
jgi:hypothetical protein